MVTRWRIGVPALVLAATMATGAAAADMALRGSLPGYEMPPAADWSGVYAGAHYGVGSGSMDVESGTRRTASRLLNGTVYESSSNGTTSASTFIAMGAPSVSPRFFGFFLGYQQQYDDAVVGFEVDYSRFSNSSTTGIYTNSIDEAGTVYNATSSSLQIFRQNATTTARLTDLATIRVRGGWAFGRVMPYVTAGLAIGRGDVSTSYNANLVDVYFDPTTGAETSRVGPYNLRDVTVRSNGAFGAGFTLGTGIEALITNNLFVRGEYSFLRIPSLAGVPITLHTARLGLGLKY